jgi:hypothetical protein
MSGWTAQDARERIEPGGTMALLSRIAFGVGFTVAVIVVGSRRLAAVAMRAFGYNQRKI